MLDVVNVMSKCAMFCCRYLGLYLSVNIGLIYYRYTLIDICLQRQTKAAVQAAEAVVKIVVEMMLGVACRHQIGNHGSDAESGHLMLPRPAIPVINVRL